MYVGEWNRKINGKGVYTWENGDSYEGTFSEDKRSGYGEYSWKNGSKICGNWSRGKLNGEVKYEMDGEQTIFQMIDGEAQF